MIKKIIILCCTVSFINAFRFVDFDISMQSERYASIVERGYNKQLLHFFSALYRQQKKKVLKKSDIALHIPNIMHHVWFGKPLSDEFKQLRKTWTDMHHDWIYILWTDRASNDDQAVVVRSFEELQELLDHGFTQRIVVLTDTLAFNNKVHFDNASNYGERSDILKWEIVYRYGGVYIDTDFECYRPLNELHYLFDFYTCLQPLDTGMVQLGAALFAARPYHPILARCVQDITPGEGPIIVRTGPIHFTNVCINTLVHSEGYNIVLPSSYFYPCGYEESLQCPYIWKKPESFGVHHWAGSWLTADAFVS